MGKSHSHLEKEKDTDGSSNSNKQFGNEGNEFYRKIEIYFWNLKSFPKVEIKSIISFNIFIYEGNNAAITALLAYEDIAEDIITNSKVINLLHILNLPYI